MNFKYPIAIAVILYGALPVLPAGEDEAEVFRKQIHPPGNDANATGLIRAAISETLQALQDSKFAMGILTLAPGDYHLDAFPGDEDVLLPIYDSKNLTLRGSGPSTRLVIRDEHPNPQGYCRKVISVHNSENFILENLSIDFSPGARDWLQGTARDVVSTGEGITTFTLVLDPASPPFRPAIFDPARCFLLGMVQNAFFQIRADFPDHFPGLDIQPGEGNTLQVSTRIPDVDAEAFLSGQRVVIAARKPGEALFCFAGDNQHPVLRKLVISASRGMLIEAYGCNGLELDGLKLAYAPGQWLVSPGDGLHYQGGVSGPNIHDSHFEGLGDDAMNIYAKPFAISHSESATYLFEDAHSRVHSGDQLWLYPAGQAWGGKLVSVTQTRPGQFQIAEDVPGEPWTRAVNLSRSGQNFVVRNNSFGPLRGLGCRLQTGPGLVEKNRFRRLSGAAVSLECGLTPSSTYGLGEGPFPFAIRIQGNQFSDCASSRGYNRIPIRRVGEWDPGKASDLAFRGIRMKSNTIVDGSGELQTQIPDEP